MITVSLCMIVRNEEATLGRCLKSIAPFADEVIVVDTGSGDQTKAVAEAHGARVFDFAWSDDFAAARNASFGHAQMDYIMWLDADDILLPEDRDKLLALKRTFDTSIDAVSMAYHTAFDAEGHVLSSTRRLRIVRASSGFRWTGVVHEDLRTDAPFRYLDSDIAITHRKPEGDGTRSTRNLDIYARHLAAGRRLSTQELFHYARELQMHERYEEAIPHYEAFLADKASDANSALFALHNLATCLHHTGDMEGEWQCTLRSFAYDSPRPEFACRMGERFIAEANFPAAAYWYQQALTAARPSADEWAVHLHPFSTWLPHKQLGLCFYQLGDYRRSLDHNLAAQHFRPSDAEITTNIATLRRLLGQQATDSTPHRPDLA